MIPLIRRSKPSINLSVIRITFTILTGFKDKKRFYIKYISLKGAIQELNASKE